MEGARTFGNKATLGLGLCLHDAYKGWCLCENTVVAAVDFVAEVACIRMDLGLAAESGFEKLGLSYYCWLWG